MVMDATTTLEDVSPDTALATYLRRCLREAGVTQSDAALRLGRHQTWFPNYLFRTPERTVRKLFAEEPDIFDTLISTLSADRDKVLRLAGISVPPVPSAEVLGGGSAVPLYESSAGPDLQPRDIIDYIGVPEVIEGGAGELIAIRVRGDAMTPYLEDGEVAYVRRGATAKPGDAVGAFVPGHGTVVMTFLRELPGGEVLFQVENPANGSSPVFSAPTGTTIHGPVVRRLKDG